jgi:predicted dehydrogenase
MSIQKESVLAVIGGGRWGQVLLSILGNIPLPFDRVVVVSKFNAHEVIQKFETLRSSTLFSLVESIENLLAQYNVKAAIIVNSAQQHFDTALILISQGIHVLIEKPLVLSAKQMNILIKKATEKEVCIFPGLCYRFCSYLDNFKKIMGQEGTPYRFIMQWHDTASEIRYGKLKKHDASLDVAQDVMPHVWTILSKIFEHPLIEINASLDHDITDDYATIQISLKNIAGQVVLKRNAPIRERSIVVELENQKFLKIDFSNEPGMISSESGTFSADIAWNNKLSPLTQQLNQFFLSIQAGKSTKEEVEACLNSVNCSESASNLLKTHKNFNTTPPLK